jgi:hypothetical protein
VRDGERLLRKRLKRKEVLVAVVVVRAKVDIGFENAFGAGMTEVHGLENRDAENGSCGREDKEWRLGHGLSVLCTGGL